MYVRVVSGRYSQDASPDEVTRLTEEHLVPALQRLPGFQSYWGGYDAETFTVIGLTAFDTQEHANYSREQVAAGLAPLYQAGMQLDPPRVYEITVQA